MKLKAVIFDLGGTLIQTLEVSEIMRQMLEAKGIMRSLKEINEAREKADRCLIFKELPILREEFWIKWNANILRALEIKNDTEILARWISDAWWDYAQARLYPEVRKVLKRLKKKNLKLGIITNGLKSDADKVLPLVGLKETFDVIVVTDSIGKMKPEKEVFLYALNELDIAPHEVLFIGDRIEEDYYGAKSTGIKAFLLDRENKIEEDVEKIRSLEEIFEKLDI